MLITALLIAVVIGIVVLRSFKKTETRDDNKVHNNLKPPLQLKDAMNIEAAQEIHPYEERKKFEPNNNKIEVNGVLNKIIKKKAKKKFRS